MSVSQVADMLNKHSFLIKKRDVHQNIYYALVANKEYSIALGGKEEGDFLFSQASSSSFSLKEKERCFFGEFKSDLDYLSAVAFLFSQTKETANRASFIRCMIDVSLFKKERILELGVGDGEVSRAICSGFKEITFVDKSKRLLDLLCAASFPRSRIRKIVSEAESCDYFDGEYDCIVVSHLLYYINYASWGLFLKTLYDRLSEGGVIFVVLSGGGDKEKIARNFGGVPCDIDKLVSCVSGVFLNERINVYDIDEVCEVRGLDEALCVSDVYLNDSGGLAKRSLLSLYLNKVNKIDEKDGSRYLFSFTQRFVVIQK